MGNIQITSPGIKKALKKYEPEQAIAEYIWNGFDAKATQIELVIDSNPIGGIESIRILDNGYGIPFDKLKYKFEPFFESEKEIDPDALRTTSAVHGKNGVGRLTFFSFAFNARWETVYSSNGTSFKYNIFTDASMLNTYSHSEPEPTTLPTGTMVEFKGIRYLTVDDFADEISEFLGREFGWFLELNSAKRYKLRINGKDLDYTGIIGDKEVFVHWEEGNPFEIRYVRWKKSINKEFSRYYFIDSSETEQHKETTTLNYKGDHFYHSVFVRSAFFNDFYPNGNHNNDDGAQLTLIENTKNNKTFKNLMRMVDSFLRTKRKPFLKAYTDILIAEFEKDGAFPRFNGNEWDQYRRAELEQLVRELYQVEPKIFSKLNTRV